MIIKHNAVYKDFKKLQLENGEEISCDKLDLPYGSLVELIISYDDADILNGLNNIVWATHSLQQAEIIHNALEVEKIKSVIIHRELKDNHLFLLEVKDVDRVNKAINFIWKSKDGLRLTPDWFYPSKTPNKSFQKWIS